MVDRMLKSSTQATHAGPEMLASPGRTDEPLEARLPRAARAPRLVTQAEAVTQPTARRRGQAAELP